MVEGKEEKTQTNADCIRAMTDEELAKFLNNYRIENIVNEWCLKLCPERKSDPNMDCDCQYMEQESILGWLKMNAEGSEEMDAQEALRKIVEDGIELGGGDFVEVEALKVTADALKKQIPRRPSYFGDGYADGYLVYDTYECPNCGKQYEVDYDDYDYCPNCGQRLDRTMEEEDGREEPM